MSANFASFTCRICSNTAHHRRFTATERQFGMGDQFEYVECASCGSLQIAKIPADLGRFYPTHYYSFQATDPVAATAPNWLRRTLRARRSLHTMYGKDWIGALVARHGGDYFPYPWEWFIETKVRPDSAILDVGCGSGKLLRAMRHSGFSNLVGVDPFVAQPVHEPNLRIDRCELRDLDGSFDLVMLHHSLEHVPDIRSQLQAAADRCRPGGHVLVRLPIADCHGWRNHPEHWFALDPPRHLNIPTRHALSALAVECGLETVSVRCDMDATCVWGTELYLRGVPYMDQQGRLTTSSGHPDNPFTADEMAGFRQQAEALNAADDGDTACFVLSKRS